MIVRFRNHVRVESQKFVNSSPGYSQIYSLFFFLEQPLSLSFTPSEPWKISRIIIFVTLDGVRSPHRDGQSRIATIATIIRQLSTARRPRVRDYDKSMIAVGEFITRLARMRFRSRGRSRKASLSTGVRTSQGSFNGGRRQDRTVSQSSSLHGNKNIGEKHRQWPPSLWVTYAGQPPIFLRRAFVLRDEMTESRCCIASTWRL